MARLFGTGFEMGSLQAFEILGRAEASVWGASTDQARNGSWSFRCSATGSLSQSLSGNPGEIFLRIGFYYVGGSGARPMFSLLNPAGTLQLTMTTNSATNRFELRRGTHLSAIIAEGSIIQTAQWYCLEMHVVADPVAGSIEMLLDGATDLTFSGDSFDAAAIGLLRLGTAVSAQLWNGYFDDIAVNDTTGTYNNSWCGRGGFWPVIPNGIGTASGFTPEPALDDNWECVDDIPPDEDTSYVQSDTVDVEDLYQVAALTPTTGTINAVHYWTRARMSEPGIGGLRRLIRHEATNYEGTDLAFDTSYRYEQSASHILERAPDDTEWTIAKVNALEIGQKII